MPPKKPSTEQPPSKSLLNFFDRSPATDGSPSTVQNTARTPRKSNESKPIKRSKSGSKAVIKGSKGTSNAPLVISDDDEVAVQVADGADTILHGDIKNKGESSASAFRGRVIDISDDDMGGDVSSKPPLSASRPVPVTASRARTLSKGQDKAPELLGTTHASPSSEFDSTLVPNGILSTTQNPGISSDVATPIPDIKESADAEGSTLAIEVSQKSNLEQALEEEEGEWNEGDEEGMGMEDLDIGDDEDVMADTMESPAAEEEGQDPMQGGEKRKRKGKQKAILPRDCSPEIIAIDESDGGDDDSLGGREEVDDFDVDDDECPVCGRTFVGMRGDVSRMVS